MKKYSYEFERNDYLTPPALINDIFKILEGLGICSANEFECDVCCSLKNIPAKNYFINGVSNGLEEDWYGFNYCNPPYNDCEKWVNKAYQEFKKCKTSVMLIPARTETRYWQECILENGYATKENVYVKYLRKGYAFINPEKNRKMGIFKNALAIVIFDGRNL